MTGREGAKSTENNASDRSWRDKTGGKFSGFRRSLKPKSFKAVVNIFLGVLLPRPSW